MSIDISLLPCLADPSCHRCTGELHWILKTHEGLQRSNDRVDHLFAFKRRGNPNPDLWEELYQTFIHDAHLVPVHSHNDYTRLTFPTKTVALAEPERKYNHSSACIPSQQTIKPSNHQTLPPPSNPNHQKLTFGCQCSSRNAPG